MTKTTSKYFLSEIEFYIEDYPSCCGIEIVSSLNCEENDEGWGNKRFPSIDKAVEHFCKRVNQERRKTYLQLSVVTRYNGSRKGDKGQMPDGFVTELEKRGWTKDRIFKNSNTGNEVTVLSKVFPKKRVKALPNGGIFSGNSW